MMSHVSPLPPLTLVLGGQRSGKSAYAERLFTTNSVYLATAHTGDEEMVARIKTHQNRRGKEWVTVEEPRNITHALNDAARLYGDRPVLVDSLGMWVANALHAGLDPVSEATIMAEAMVNHVSAVVVVSEEVGLGTVPMNKVARSFVDALGEINQTMAAHATRVVHVCAGLALVLKEG